ncbi:dynamin family protein [Streptomyces sp. NPDC002550]
MPQPEESVVPKTPARSTLGDKLRPAVEAARTKAGGAIDGLTGIAQALSMTETAAGLRETAQQLRADTFKILIMGRFKNGKSTLLNALLGGTTRPVELHGHQGPMIVDDLPATAVLTEVRYADEPYVRVWSKEGKSETWTLGRYLNESALGVDREENKERFEAIRQFEMGFPALLCADGFTIYDSPGLEDEGELDVITLEAVRRCDVAIVVYSTSAAMGKGERMNAAKAVDGGARVFSVVNLWDGRPVDERLRAFIWNRYVHEELGGPKYTPERDLTAQGLFFVDARAARKARYGGDETDAVRSGLTDFEQYLGAYLQRERLQIHLSKFATQAGGFADGIEQHIGQRRAAVAADQQQLLAAYQTVQPRLDELSTRPGKLAPVFRRARREAEATLSASFQSLHARILQDLPGHLETVQPPTGDNFLKVFQQKQLVKELYQEVGSYLDNQVMQWATEQALDEIGPVLENLTEEIEAEATLISAKLEDIHLELTGWRPEASGKGVVTTKERLLTAVGSVLLGDLPSALGGGAGGLRGAVGAAVGGLTAGFVLAVAGLVGTAVFWPVALAVAALGSILGGGSGLVKRARRKVLADAEAQLPKMRAALLPKIAEELGRNFDAMESAVTAEFRKVVDEERRNVEDIIKLNQADRAARAKTLTELEAFAGKLAEHRTTLKAALTVAKQG